MMSVSRPIDSTRMRPRQRTELINQLEKNGVKVAADAERRATRVVYNGQVVVTVDHPSGAASRFVVYPRNLSAKGMAFVHGGFLYPGSRCLILMNDLAGKGHQMPGQVRGCRHVNGLVHEVSVIFNDAIKLDEFVVPTAKPATQEKPPTGR